MILNTLLRFFYGSETRRFRVCRCDVYRNDVCFGRITADKVYLEVSNYSWRKIDKTFKIMIEDIDTLVADFNGIIYTFYKYKNEMCVGDRSMIRKKTL